ncbi:hypothetical protein SDC9_183283 [bioreactor metagenome]|uniref:Sensor histidine kinase NatK-like C-terminal domain-containing protein n=1 Tax=bioreactor metagenome TaxID=1076179 RepID=A0A645H9T6_9ZZZZ
MVKNSTSGYLKMSGSSFLSNKSGKHHGIGLRRIDEITTKYGGYVSRTHDNSVFETNIMLPLEKVLVPV